MDPIIFYQNGRAFGEIGIDEEASPGNGQFYINHYSSAINQCGFDSLEEAFGELAFISNLLK